MGNQRATEVSVLINSPFGATMTLLSAGARGSKATKGETIEKLPPPILFDQNPEILFDQKPECFI